MKSVRLAQIFSSELGGKPDAEWCSVEDLPTKCGQKRCAKMAVLNLSVLPLAGLSVMTKTATMETEMKGW
ncbi:hypothetical protein AXF19_03085 [Selenomonas sp. oral taxon 126]|nr:hypothetical protein [Selenomonas sp. oral taxon 126]ANR70072.1 hypothetical protein AXF19_03085 [Selenomonas sp. oral taxon 126]